MSDVVASLRGKLANARNLEAYELGQLAQQGRIRSAQAMLAVWAMLDCLMARLPSPMVGRIREQLGIAKGVRLADGGVGGAK